MSKYDGKSAVITGGSSGFGLATALSGRRRRTASAPSPTW